MDPARKVDASWGAVGAEAVDDFVSNLVVVTHDKPGILSEVSGILSSMGANISKAQVQVGKDRLGYLEFEVTLQSAVQLQNIMTKIESIPVVMRVERRVAGYQVAKRKKKKTPK